MVNAPWRAVGIALVSGIAACSSAGGSDDYTPGGGNDGGVGGNTDASILPTDGSFLDTTGEASAPFAKTHLKGKVVAPEGTIPISGALVYVQLASPGAIPDGTYCDKCVKISQETPYTTTKPDGTFDLPTWKTGAQKLIVQKGAFRRVRDIQIIDEGDQDVPLELTTLPGRMDKANGDDIPKMAIIPGGWDEIELSLAKLGLAKVTVNSFGKAKVDFSTAGFDYYQPSNPLDFSDPKQPTVFLKDMNAVSKYHIIFFPCAGTPPTSETPGCTSTLATTGAVKDNLRNFVASGGKLYATDYSYEYVRQLFPGYLTWGGETDSIGSACTLGEWSAAADVKDQGLQDWLTAMNITDWDVQKSYTTVEGVHAVDTQDMDGNPAKVTPKVWVEGSGVGPATVSFERSCGRVLFSTYHTEADKGSPTELLPQEKALLYILLEVAVCVAPPDIY